jgi:hypothetical protein
MFYTPNGSGEDIVKTLNEWILGELVKNNWTTSRVSYEEAKKLFPQINSAENFTRQVRRVKQRNVALKPTGYLNNEDIDQILSGKPEEILTDGNEFVEENNSAELTIKTKQIKSLEEMVKACNVDLSIWNIERHLINKWDSTIRTDQGVAAYPNFQVKVWLNKKVPDVQEIPVVHPIKLNVSKRIVRNASSTDIKKYLVIADAQIGFNRHMPSNSLETFHDRKAMDAVLKILQENTFEEIIINGDMLDFAEASKYVQKPEFAQTMQPSINELGWYLAQIRELAPTSRMVYLIGNHEVRLQRQLIENFKFAYNLKAFKDSVPFYSLRRLLDLDSIDCELIDEYPSGAHWIGDHLRIIHGEFTSIAKELSTSNDSVIFGHLHKMEMQSKTVHHKNGQRQISVVTSGCLCKIDGTVPGVNTRPSWQQGIICVETFGDNHTINHIPIWNGTALFNGKAYFGQEYDIDSLLN